MRIGFFGGSFDPPHRGHLAVAQAAASAFHLQRVMMAPVALQPLKRDCAEASFEDRLRMVELLCQGTKGIEASAADGPRANGEPNYTIETLRQLRERLPESSEIFVIVGADAFLTFRRWRDPEELLQMAQWIVVSRPHAAKHSWEDLQLTEAQRARVHELQGVSEPASATLVRKRLHAGESCEDMVPALILDYIHARHLYGT
jgi:nicotinate-nucleotide adenylyltransferase